MIEKIGNFWGEYDKYDAIVCTTNQIVKSNGELVMGGGIAYDFAVRYPYLPLVWGYQTRKKIHLTIAYEQQWLIGMPTKKHYKDPSPIDLIEKSCNELVKFADEYKLNSVLMTRPGCGLGGLSWHNVKPCIETILDDRFTVIER